MTDSAAPIYEGWLEKPLILGFKSKRYCRLISTQFSIFENPDSANPEEVLEVLRDWTVDMKGPTGFVIVRPDTDPRVFIAPSADERMRWVFELRTVAFTNPKLTLGMFHVISVLGRGSFGKILLCQSKFTHEFFAIKAVSKARLLSDVRMKLTLTERNVLIKIDHPFVVSLRFAFQSASKLYLGLEYASGGDLYTYMSKVGPLPLEHVRFYVAEIAVALEYIHSLGIIYRDLKADNIMLDAEGHIKITDFGLAKELPDGTTKSFCGTTEYLAPELVNRQPYSFSVDWWSLGILAYRMRYGVTPFRMDGENRLVVYENILESEPDFREGTPPEFVAFVRILLAKDPETRAGFEEIKASEFMAGLNREAVLDRKLAPPHIPDGTAHGLRNFAPEFRAMSPADPATAPHNQPMPMVPWFSWGELLVRPVDGQMVSPE
jgi:serine/threonine protein kinase